MTSYTNRVDTILTNIPELAESDFFHSSFILFIFSLNGLSSLLCSNGIKNTEFEFHESLPIGVRTSSSLFLFFLLAVESSWWLNVLLKKSPQSLPDAPPANVFFRPYWLMKILAVTMTRGGYMTPKLYVPKNVWFQLGAKFTAIETKFTSCETILIYLQKMKDMDMSDINMITKASGNWMTSGSIQNPFMNFFPLFFSSFSGNGGVLSAAWPNSEFAGTKVEVYQWD